MRIHALKLEIPHLPYRSTRVLCFIHYEEAEDYMTLPCKTQIIDIVDPTFMHPKHGPPRELQDRRIALQVFMLHICPKLSPASCHVPVNVRGRRGKLDLGFLLDKERHKLPTWNLNRLLMSCGIPTHKLFAPSFLNIYLDSARAGPVCHSGLQLPLDCLHLRYLQALPAPRGS